MKSFKLFEEGIAEKVMRKFSEVAVTPQTGAPVDHKGTASNGLRDAHSTV